MLQCSREEDEKGSGLECARMKCRTERSGDKYLVVQWPSSVMKFQETNMRIIYKINTQET